MKWDSQPEVLDLCRALAFGNCHAKDAVYKDLRLFDPRAFNVLALRSVWQDTVDGTENRSIRSLFAASMVGAVRDFTDSEGAVDSALNGVPVGAWLGVRYPPLRKAMRRQLRRGLDSRVWTLSGDGSDSPRAGFIDADDGVFWPCPYCGDVVAAEDGYGRRSHLADHPDALPARGDVGCAISRRFTRDIMLLLLATLVRSESLANHRRYFEGTEAAEALEAHFARSNDPMPFERYAAMTGQRIEEFPHHADWPLC